MYRLTYLLRRRDDVPFGEFQRYWLEQHAPLVAGHADVLKIRRYIQVHTLGEPEENPEVAFRGSMMTPYDGVAELWFDHRDDVVSALGSPDGQAAGAELVEDESKFVDLEHSPAWFGYEAPQINPGPENIVATPDSNIHKIFYALNQKSGQSLDEAQLYWRMYHGPHVRKRGPVLGLMRYIQVHRLEDELNQAFADARGTTAAPFCGHAELWQAAPGDGPAFGDDAVQAAKFLAEDESRFIDFARSAIWLGKEHVIVDKT